MLSRFLAQETVQRLALLIHFPALYSGFVSWRLAAVFPCLVPATSFPDFCLSLFNCLYIFQVWNGFPVFTRLAPVTFSRASYRSSFALTTAARFPALVSSYVFPRLTIGARTCHEFWLVYLFCDRSIWVKNVLYLLNSASKSTSGWFQRQQSKSGNREKEEEHQEDKDAQGRSSEAVTNVTEASSESEPERLATTSEKVSDEDEKKRIGDGDQIETSDEVRMVE